MRLTKNKQAICQSAAFGTALKALECKGKTGRYRGRHPVLHKSRAATVYNLAQARAGNSGISRAGCINRKIPMSPARAALAVPTDETAEAAEIVERFLEASMVPDPETAARYIAPELNIPFTGRRQYHNPRHA